MSKKTNTEKQRAAMKRAAKRPRKHVRKRQQRRPNPLKRDNQAPLEKAAGIFGDPIFLGHVAGALLRYLELQHPVEAEIARIVHADTPPDAEFASEPETSSGHKPE